MVILVGMWALLIGAYDVYTHRVPNLALLPLLVVALLALLVNGSGVLGAGVLSSLCGLAVVFLLLLPGYALGRMGAGDVKFAACMGLMLGLPRTLDMLLLAGLGLGMLALVWLRLFAGNRKTRFPAASAFALAFCMELVAGPAVLPSIDWF